MDTTDPATLAAQVGRRLKALRLQRNLQQAVLAASAGISRSTLAALENHGNVTLDTLSRVMYALSREAELGLLLLPDPASDLDGAAPPKVRQRARS